jgi:hypothetical protein
MDDICYAKLFECAEMCVMQSLRIFPERDREEIKSSKVKVREAEVYIQRNKFIRSKSPIPPCLSSFSRCYTEDQLVHGG